MPTRLEHRIVPGHPDARAGETVTVVGNDPADRGVDKQLAFPQHHAPINHPLPGSNPVLNNDHGRAGLRGHPGDGVHHLLHPGRIQVRGRLIQHNDVRPHRQHAGER